MAPAVLAAARARAPAGRRGAEAGRRHGPLRPPGRRAVRDPHRADRRGRAPERQRRSGARGLRGHRRRGGRGAGRGRPRRRGRRGGRRRGRGGACGLGRAPTCPQNGSSAARRRGAASRAAGGPRRGPPLLVRARDRRRQDRRRARLRRGLAHRRHADPHPPPQPRRSVPRRAASDRGYSNRISPPLLRDQDRGRRSRDGRDLSVVRAQRGQRLGRVHDRDLRRGAHRAGREDQRVDPPLAGPGLHRHDGDRRADRAARHRPLPDSDQPLRPRAGRPPRGDRTAALRAHTAGVRRAHACQRAAAKRRGRPGLRPGGAGRAARPGAVQRRRRGPLPRALQAPARHRLQRRASSTRTTSRRRSRTPA